MIRSLILYKYRNFGEYTDQIILNSELYFASHTSFNDPFDCNLEYKDFNFYTDEEFNKYCKEKGLGVRNKEEYLQELKKECISSIAKVGILSMSLTYKNILMWSHYSEYHKGLCFGFDLRIFNSYSKVSYHMDSEYKLISFFDSDPLAITDIRKMFTTKSKFWKYEKEVRFFDFKNGIGLRKFEKKNLKEILFGCKANETNIRKIIQLCQLNGFEHVIFKKARIVSGKFELDFEYIDKSRYL